MCIITIYRYRAAKYIFEKLFRVAQLNVVASNLPVPLPRAAMQRVVSKQSYMVLKLIEKELFSNSTCLLKIREHTRTPNIHTPHKHTAKHHFYTQHTHTLGLL